MAFGKHGGVQAQDGELISGPESHGQDGTWLVLHDIELRESEKVYGGKQFGRDGDQIIFSMVEGTIADYSVQAFETRNVSALNKKSFILKV